ncbi:MAG: hypothetical protein Q9220_002133 [cf. Caloplaca sp. 1 TL-2023]
MPADLLAKSPTISSAIIGSSNTQAASPSAAASASPPGAKPAAQPINPSSHRRSLISDQLYQFALGFPQTPPEDSPIPGTPGDIERDVEEEAFVSGMGSFVFKWTHTANEVYVTGTFDDWAKSVRLDKHGGSFEKKVELPLGQKIVYKFVVDGDWTTDHTAPQEEDEHGNQNNILTPEHISPPDSSSHSMNSAAISGVSAQSTTAELAGEVPKESSKTADFAEAESSDVPGTFPETPYHEASEFSVNPIPASSGHGNPIDLKPGEKVPDPSTLTSNTVSSTAKDDPSLSKPDESEKSFGVAPLPATAGLGNPIHLEPGQKVPDPSTFTSNTIDTHVRTDKESYEKGSNAPQLPDVVTPQNERDSKGVGMFSVPGISKNMIPESSLPMGDTIDMPAERDQGAIIRSAGADATTAQLAGQVPKEATGVPQMVQESQMEAGVGAEAGNSREVVKEKSDVEKELESKVPEAPATSEGIGGQQSGGNVMGGATAIGGAAVIGGAAAIGGAAGSSSHALPASIQQSIDEMNKGSAIAPTVPDVVQESITESHMSPEAAGDKTMVGEKSTMEEELLKKVPTENATGEPAPAASAALTGSAPAPTEAQETPQATGTTEDKTSAPAATSAAVPTTSTTEAPPTKPALPKGAKSFQTKSSAPPPTPFEPASSSAAPMTTAAAPAMTPATEEKAPKTNDYSREVSPMTKTDQQSKPMVTTGVGSTSAPESSQPKTSGIASSPASPAKAAEDKKSKRRSGFFGKLKAKFSDKDKK